MKRIKVPQSHAAPPEVLEWEWLEISEDWMRLISGFVPSGARPTHIQKVCLGDLRVLEGRRNLIVSAPTNSGKSLVGYLALIGAIKTGRRALLLEPFRALAQEKFEELQDRAKCVGEFIGRKFVPVITTGDYPLDEDAMTSPPPAEGELVIATPERMEAILRNKDFDEWVGTFGAVCVDEAHLISDPKRGGTLELVLARMMSRKSPPRIVLLSATLGDAEKALRWLAPCDLASSEVRWPALELEVVGLAEGDNADAWLAEHAQKVIGEENASLMVFTHQKLSTHTAAEMLSEKTGHPAHAYHAKMSLERKRQVRSAYMSGECRILVTTTALGTGVNLPATHLVIRDTTMRPDGKMALPQLLQMAGRAGRGERSGHSVVLVRHNDDWGAEELATALNERRMPELVSGLLGAERSIDAREIDGAVRVVLSILCVAGKDGLEREEIARFSRSMLAGEDLEPVLADALRWLESPSNLLAHQRQEDDRIVATALGTAGAKAGLPPDVVAGFGRLFRDLFSVDANMEVLRQLSGLDVLLLAEILGTRGFVGGRFSEGLAKAVDDWASAARDKSVLFQKWIRGSKEFSQAASIYGSLGVTMDPKRKSGERSAAYTRMRDAIVLWSRGMGVRWEDLGRRWGLDSDQVAEDEWIRSRSWLIAGFAELCDLRCFYFHLREECGASDETIKQAKRYLQRLRAVCYKLLGRLKYCSPLGPLVVRMKSSGAKGVGKATIDKLEAAGLASPDAIRVLTDDQIRALNLDRKKILLIQSYLRRN